MGEPNERICIAVELDAEYVALVERLETATGASRHEIFRLALDALLTEMETTATDRALAQGRSDAASLSLGELADILENGPGNRTQ